MNNKIYLALLCLICSSVYAAHSDEAALPMANEVNVTAPEQSGAWSFGVTAVLMQPTNSSYEYATTRQITQNDIDNPSASGNIVNTSVLNEDYYWWFGADITYAFPGNSRDITLAYEGLHGDTTDDASNNFNNDANGGTTFHILINPLTNGTINFIQAETNTRYDAADLLLGQKLMVWQRVQLHPFLGLRYAHIDQQDSFKDTLEPFPSQGLNGGNESGSLENTFNGIGPRLGSDAGILLGKGFSVHARLGLSVLVGSEHSDYSYTTTYLFLPPSALLSVTQDAENNLPTKTLVVPEIDGRLGLNYKHTLNAATDLGVELGWQVSNYFQVINNSAAAFQGSTPERDKYSNFGLQGPYARVQLDIA